MVQVCNRHLWTVSIMLSGYEGFHAVNYVLVFTWRAIQALIFHICVSRMCVPHMRVQGDSKVMIEVRKPLAI